MSGRKGNLAPRSLEYRAPEVPNFLKALKAQVASSERYSSSSSRAGGDELDSFVTSTSSSSSGKRKARHDDEDDATLDSEDEMNGAQVVVLKDGKHLSHQEALAIKASQAQEEETSAAQGSSSAGKAQNIASTGSSGGSKKRRGPIGVHEEDKAKEASISALIEEKPPSDKEAGSAKKAGSGLDDVKKMIRKEREARAPASPKAKETISKEESKEEKRKEKNAQARKLKAKSGKGLSFDLDD